MRAKEFTIESALGTNPKRPSRPGSRPARGHKAEPRYGITKDKETKFHAELDKLVHDTFGKRDDEVEEGWFDSKPKVDWNKRAKELFAKGLNEQQVRAQLLKEGCPLGQVDVYVQGGQLEESGKASRALCTGGIPDKDLGASQLASCKSQGLRARDGKKSHKLGKSPKSRVVVGGHKIKGKKYGGPLPDWS